MTLALLDSNYVLKAYNSRPVLRLPYHNPSEENAMKWNKPAYVDFRFGFEITMYIANR